MEDVIRKIQKALALAHDKSSEKESQSAMLLAQRLMLKHNLSMSDISIQQTNEKNTRTGFIRLNRIEWWQRGLAAIIADNFKSYFFFSHGSHIGFLGLEEDVTIATELFEFGCKMIKYHASRYLSSRQEWRSRKYANALKNDYINGFLSGLNDKFKEQVEKESFALVLIKDEIVVQAYEDMKLKKGKPWQRSTAQDEDAVKQGYIDGKNFRKPQAAIENV